MVTIVLVLLSASPKDCGSDFACLAAAAATCGPAVLRTDVQLGGFDRLAKEFGAGGEVDSTYSLAPGAKGTCTLKVEQKLRAIHIAAAVRDQLLDAGKTDAELAALEKNLTKEAQSRPENDRLCVFEKAALETVLRALPRTYDSKHWDSCQRSCVEPPPAIAKGCTWGKCNDGGRSLTCKRGGKSLRCDPPKSASTLSALSPGVVSADFVVTCDKAGEPSLVMAPARP